MRLFATSYGLSGCLAVLVLAACSSGSQSVASKYVATAVIGPEGGTIPVSASDDATLAGTTIVIPAHALSSSTTISIGLAASGISVNPSGKTAAGPVVDFEPSGTVFALPVTISIPVSLASGTVAKDVFIEAVESDGTEKQIAAQSVGSGLVTFQANGFTNFGAWTGGSTNDDGGVGPGDLCSTDADCATGTVCVDGHCDTGTTSTGDAGVDAVADVVTDASVDVVTGGNCSTNADCASGEVCDGNVCASSTGDSDACVPLTCANQGAQCGDTSDGCGNMISCGSCASGQSCVDGSCQSGASDASTDSDGTTCAAGQTDCNGVCVDISSDSKNCGSCGSQCPAGSSCSSGECAT